ncbi:MAG: histidine kinase dimerization/phospho-acceptor domain-containing protein [Egibacteraceae bacterium]
MRRRLLTSTIAAAAAAVFLLGLPLALAVRRQLQQEALDTLQRQAEQIQMILNEQPLSPADQLGFLQRVGQDNDLRLILLENRGGFRLRLDTGPPPDLPPGLPPDVDRAIGGQVGRGLGGGVIAVSIPVRVGGVDQVVRAVRGDDGLRHDIRTAWVAIAGLALLALGTAALFARRQGEQLAAPLEALAGAARRLGDGDFTARAPYSGLPEADDVARALEATAERLGAMLERSRSFSGDASHQLRTPLTALRLDLEALEAAGADPTLVGAATAEADRLEATIAELLTLSDAPPADRLCDVADLAGARLDAWQSLARVAGREVVLETSPVPLVRARPGAMGQCLQVLLDNALEHGAGRITVSVQAVAAGGGLGLTGEGPDTKWVRLCVADEGSGIPVDRQAGLLSGRADAAAGRGLALARQLVEAEGGRLSLERAAPGATLCLLVPAVGQT